ncbi:MAG: hypothetical protein LUG26_07795 [Ruminococcus sp.]|nr:hypothetical protein [Ruminococcus sp.]
MTTKEQELRALEKIRKIVEELGDDSYVGTALEGCFEIAEDNIGNDFACSMKQRAESAEKRAEELDGTASYYSAEYDKALEEISRLRKQLEKEQEWRPYIDTDNVRQEDYDKLVQQSDTRYLTDDEAKDILYDWYGFSKDKITIHRSIAVLEVNRHRQLRKVGVADRRPTYNATDWNYIRFDCGAMSYELYNDNLRFYVR